MCTFRKLLRVCWQSIFFSFSRSLVNIVCGRWMLLVHTNSSHFSLHTLLTALPGPVRPCLEQTWAILVGLLKATNAHGFCHCRSTKAFDSYGRFQRLSSRVRPPRLHCHCADVVRISRNTKLINWQWRTRARPQQTFAT